MEIIINNLSKNYGKRAALEKVSLTIPSGMYGLLGRNGAGKTSLMRIMVAFARGYGGMWDRNVCYLAYGFSDCNYFWVSVVDA